MVQWAKIDGTMGKGLVPTYKTNQIIEGSRIYLLPRYLSSQLKIDWDLITQLSSADYLSDMD